ncbi:MAG: CvpA family protein, partial [Planctomycetota bacterium]
MFTLIGIVVGIAAAYYGFKRGFFEMWGFFFNLLVSMYLAIFLRPFITDHISESGNSWIGITLTILLTGLGIFLILYGISFVAFGQFSIVLPKILDISGGAIVGFIGGILLWSLLIFLLSITPLSQSSSAKSIGMVKYSTENKATYICWWGDFINFFASSSDSRHSTEEMMVDIFKSAEV